MSTEILKPLPCPACGTPLVPAPSVSRKPAAKLADCLRKCATCDLGYSNALNDPTVIHGDAAANVPIEVRPGVTYTLSNSLNVRNRRSKMAKFGFSTSEDALTWTAFSYLAGQGLLAQALQGIAISFATSPGALLLWGVPVPAADSQAQVVEKRLVEVSDQLRESPLSRSEPDVIVDFGSAGLVLIEVKRFSRNECRKDAEIFTRYLSANVFFHNPRLVVASGLYELARNWRIGCELAGGRPLQLVNLVVAPRAAETARLQKFQSGLAVTPQRVFRQVTWANLLGAFKKPGWLEIAIAKGLRKSGSIGSDKGTSTAARASTAECSRGISCCSVDAQTRGPN